MKPPYGKQLMEMRQDGEIPKFMVYVVFSWELARKSPRIVIPDDLSHEGLDFDYLAGLPVQIAYHNKDSHKVDVVSQDILAVNPCFLAILALDLLDTGEARTILKPYEARKAA